MPTYAVTSAKSLTPEQRASIVESVTSIHQVEATAPRYFVQVVFYEVGAGSMFIGGKTASPDHVWVRADIRSGRTKEQKAQILLRIMKDVSEILDVTTEDVWVYISDIPAEGVAEFGAILPEPGREDQWLAALPGPLREKLVAVS